MGSIVIDGVIFGLQNSGGISRCWAEFILGIDEILALHKTVYLLIPANSNIEWKEIENQLKHIKVLKRPRLKYSYWLNRAYLSFLALLLKPDCWHTSYYLGLPWGKCKKKIAPLFDMIQEIYGLDPLHTRQKRSTLKSATHIISISRHSKLDLERLWPDIKAETEVIYISSSKTKVLSDKEKHPSLLFLGRRGGYKNFLKCIHALLQDSFFNDYEIIAIGGENDWSNDEAALFTQHNAWKRIRKLGVVSVEETQKLIANATAILYPSLYEGFGLPVLEAFQLETPVLACRTSSIPEIAGDEYPLADPHDPQSYCSTLKELLSNREKWIAYGKERQLRFSREKTVEQTCELYFRTTSDCSIV